MASAQNTNSDRLVIFRGDDTGGTFGRRLAFTIEAGDGVDLSGCRAEWIFDGIVKTFDAPLTAGETRELFYSHNETERMCIGVRYGTFRIIDSAGKRATMTNTRAVEVTDNVARCYPGASAATVRIGTFISWENISGKPLLVKTVNGEAPDASGNINIKIEEPVLDDTVTEKSPNGVKSSGIWSWVKSLLPHWLTGDYAEPATVASVADKRDKSDLAVYSVTRTENTDWTWTSENKELEEVLNDSGVKPIWYETGSGWSEVDPLPDGWGLVQGSTGSPHDAVNLICLFCKLSGDYVEYIATATRPRYMDETLGPAKSNQQLAAVATDDAAKPADGSLMKYDAANDRFVKAVEGTDYLKTHQDISGKLDKSGGQMTGTLSGGDGFGWIMNRQGESLHDVLGTFPTYLDLDTKADRATTLSGYGITDGATKTELAAAVSTNNPAFVSAVQNTPAPEPGQGEDPPWGTWGTVGAAIAGLVAGLKWLKDKVFDSAGNIQDQFATDLLGKQVANVKANTVSLAAAYSETETYSVGDAVTHDGKLYKCAVAIATAEAWTPAHWTETTVATLWSDADTTSYGGQN